MATTNEQYESCSNDDLVLLTETLEEVLESSSDPTSQKYLELKAKAKKSLNEVKYHINQASDAYYVRVRQVVTCADKYVRDKPWQGIGLSTTLGLIVGLLLARR